MLRLNRLSGYAVFTLVVVGVISGFAVGGTTQEILPTTDAGELIAVNVSRQAINLSESQPIMPCRESSQAEYTTHGSFDVAVGSILPEWAVGVRAEEIHGSHGSMPPARIWVRSSATGQEFVALDSQVTVLAGNRSVPVTESSVDISVRPSWLDVAGEYSGQLTVSPYLPSMAAIGDTDPQVTVPVGQNEEIGISFSVQEFIDLSVTRVNVTFEQVTEAGRYETDKEINILLSTNAAHWKIVADSVLLSHTQKPDRTIPLERVTWRLWTAPPDEMETSGVLLPGVVLLEGTSPVENLNAHISFATQILPSDEAGEYKLEIRLLGQSGR